MEKSFFNTYRTAICMYAIGTSLAIALLLGHQVHLSYTIKHLQDNQTQYLGQMEDLIECVKACAQRLSYSPTVKK
jgi:hypothetical protein